MEVLIAYALFLLIPVAYLLGYGVALAMFKNNENKRKDTQ